MLFGHPGHITTPPDSPKGESWPKESQQEVVGSVLVLELGGEERLRSPSTTPPRLDRLRLSCSRHMAVAEILALQPRGFCNLPLIRWAFVCLPCRNSNQLSFVYSAEEKEQLVTFPA